MNIYNNPERSLSMNKQVIVINPNSSDFWRKFYEIVSPDIDKFFTYANRNIINVYKNL